MIDQDKLYLSHGGGVNSTALMLLLMEKGEEFEAVFADHGGDYPETYEYIEMLQSKGYPITVIKARRKGMTLYDYCVEYGILPAIKWRWCTSHWKIKPLEKYMVGPAFDLIGIDAGEGHRARYSERKQVISDYPLIRWGINREGCIEVIKRHGLPIPKKSGCWFCFFQRKSQWRELRDEYPTLWCKALYMEARCVEKQRAKGKSPYTIKTKPLAIYINEAQGDLFDGFRQPCMCELL